MLKILKQAITDFTEFIYFLSKTLKICMNYNYKLSVFDLYTIFNHMAEMIFSQSHWMESGCDGYSQQSTETCIKRTVHSKEASNFNISCAITVCNFQVEKVFIPDYAFKSA